MGENVAENPSGDSCGETTRDHLDDDAYPTHSQIGAHDGHTENHWKLRNNFSKKSNLLLIISNNFKRQSH